VRWRSPGFEQFGVGQEAVDHGGYPDAIFRYSSRMWGA